MRVKETFLAALLATVGVNAQVTASNNPLNSFISQVVSIASQIDPASPTQPSKTSASASAQSTSDTAQASSVTTSSSRSSPISTAAAAATSSAAAAASAAGGGLSQRDHIILGVCLALGILLILLLGLLLCVCLRRRRRRRAEQDAVIHEESYWEKRDGPHHNHDSHLLGTHRNQLEKNGHYGHGSEAAAAITGAGVGAAVHKRHSEASDHGLIAGAQDFDQHRMSGGSGLGNPYRRSEGSMNDPANDTFTGLRTSAGSGVNGLAMHANPASSIGVKRKPLPGQDHHDTMLGAGAGALAGAVAYKHHRDKHDAQHSLRGAPDGQHAPAEQVTSHLHPTTYGANENLQHNKGMLPHAAGAPHNNRGSYGVHQDSPSHLERDGALIGAAAYANHRQEQKRAHESRNSPEGYNSMVRERGNVIEPRQARQDIGNHRDYNAGVDERDRPPTPFGLGAFAGSSAHRNQPQPFEGTRRSGSFPDATVVEQAQGYSHGYHGYSPHHPLPNYSHPNDEEQAFIPYTPSGPYDAAVAASTPRYDRRSLPPEGRPHRPPFADDGGYGRRSLGGTPPRQSFADEPRRSSGPGMRVPAAALGAVGRGSPRMTAYQRESSDSSSGHSGRVMTGRRGEALGPGIVHPRPPYASNHASYSSLASEGMTPIYDIPGAFPGEERRGSKMREERWNHTGGQGNGNNNGNGNGNSNGRRLRFSDRNEEYEIENRE